MGVIKRSDVVHEELLKEIKNMVSVSKKAYTFVLENLLVNLLKKWKPSPFSKAKYLLAIGIFEEYRKFVANQKNVVFDEQEMIDYLDRCK